MRALAAREAQVLCSVVEQFVRTSVPVGSRTVAKKSPLRLSAASIRNVMSDLEEAGLLAQPHTSAGRIPSDSGYRWYVDHLPPETVTPDAQHQLQTHIRTLNRNVDEILRRASVALGRVAHQLGVVLAPQAAASIFEKLELVPIRSTHLVVVLSFRTGVVKTVTLETAAAFPREQLEETARVLNERLSGLTIQEIVDSIRARMRDVHDGVEDLIEVFMRSPQEVFRADTADSLHLGDTRPIMVQPEFADRTRLEAVFDLVEDRQTIIQLLQDRKSYRGLTITIGHENPTRSAQALSVVTAGYCVGNGVGIVGVIGPTRMPYARVMPLVQYTAHMITEVLAN